MHCSHKIIILKHNNFITTMVMTLIRLYHFKEHIFLWLSLFYYFLLAAKYAISIRFGPSWTLISFLPSPHGGLVNNWLFSLHYFLKRRFIIGWDNEKWIFVEKREFWGLTIKRVSLWKLTVFMVTLNHKVSKQFHQNHSKII